MYLYVSFFSEEQLQSKQRRLWGHYFELVKRNFPSYHELSGSNVVECIGFYRKKEDGAKPVYRLSIKKVEIDETEMTLHFDVLEPLDVSSDAISRAIYGFGKQEGWYFQEDKFSPILSILDKAAFDTIRKGAINTRKLSNTSAKLDQLKAENNWEEICSMYEPLEDVQSSQDLWNNAWELYSVGFACSKLGEPANGQEQNKEHLAQVKRYRELSIIFYSRCIELEPSSSQYLSALAYRYYRNVTELTKQKGRRDGKVTDEIQSAHFDSQFE